MRFTLFPGTALFSILLIAFSVSSSHADILVSTVSAKTRFQQHQVTPN